MRFKNYTKYKDSDNLDKLLQFVTDKLSITSGEVILSTNDRILDMFGSKDLHLEAILQPTPIKDTFNLILRNRESSDVELILCHEMIHLNQYLNGDLKLDWDKKEFYWKGVKYENTIPYDNRPWEKEAFKQQYSLLKDWRKYKKELKKQEKSTKKCKLFGK